MNFQNSAVLFAITEPESGLGQAKAEEIGQISSIDQLIADRESFIPFGFVPTYWCEEKEQQKWLKVTVILNLP